MKISVVSPVYNAERILDELVRRIESSLSSLSDSYEIILVDDRGPDKSWQKIESLCAANPNVKGLKLSRNFGQHAAIKAGLSEVTGDCAIVMDCDLQHDPVYITNLVQEWQTRKVDIVYTRTSGRNHSKFKNVTARIYSWFFNILVDKSLMSSSENVGSFSLISRKVIYAFKNYHDYQFHYLMVLKWLGFEHSYIEIEHMERHEGKGSYSLRRLIDHALVGIVYQSNKLLTINIVIGFVIASLSLIGGVIVVLRYFFYGAQSGWPSLFLLLLFSLGTLLSSMGVIGLYLSRMFEQVKKRPQYIVDKHLNFD